MSLILQVQLQQQASMTRRRNLCIRVNKACTGLITLYAGVYLSPSFRSTNLTAR